MPEKPEKLTETTVTIGGLEHTLMLNEEDAARYADAEASAEASSKAKTPANKARQSESK